MLRGHLTRHTAALAVGALLLGACSGASSATDEPTGPEIGFDVSESPTESADPWAAPDPLTEEYILRVLTEIERESAGFYRWLLTANPESEVPSSVADHIRRTYLAEIADDVLTDLMAGFRNSDGDASHLADPFGAYRVAELTVHRSDTECPLVEVVWDGSAAVAEGSDSTREPSVIGLSRQSGGAPVNASGWVYGFAADRAKVSDDAIAAELEERRLCA